MINLGRSVEENSKIYARFYSEELGKMNLETIIKENQTSNLVLFNICSVDNIIFIKPRNYSKATFLKVYLADRIDEADCTNFPIHPGCLYVFTSIIIHP